MSPKWFEDSRTLPVHEGSDLCFIGRVFKQHFSLWQEKKSSGIATNIWLSIPPCTTASQNPSGPSPAQRMRLSHTSVQFPLILSNNSQVSSRAAQKTVFISFSYCSSVGLSRLNWITCYEKLEHLIHNNIILQHNRCLSVLLNVVRGNSAFVLSLCVCSSGGSPAAGAWLCNVFTFLCFHCLQRHIISQNRCRSHTCMLTNHVFVMTAWAPTVHKQTHACALTWVSHC